MDLRKLLLKMYTLYKFDGKEFVIVHILVKTLYWTASRVMARPSIEVLRIRIGNQDYGKYHAVDLGTVH